MNRRNVNNRLKELQNMQTPETPRIKKKDSSLADAIIKAKKYDALIKQIKQDRTALLKEFDDYNNQRSFLRVGYKNGYIDGKVAIYKRFLDMLTKYSEG